MKYGGYYFESICCSLSMKHKYYLEALIKERQRYGEGHYKGVLETAEQCEKLQQVPGIEECQ